MATFDQLPAQQQAIIELVLKRGQSYDELGEMLGMPTPRIKELARESLVSLAPLSAAEVDEDSRGQIADYLLHQQSETDAAAARGLLRRSEGARAWSRSVLDSLEQFYDPANLPSIPGDGDGAGPRAPELAEPRHPGPAQEPAEPPEPQPAAQERLDAPAPAPPARSPEAHAWRVASAVGLAAVVAVAILLWPLGLLTGDDGGRDGGGGPRPRLKAVATLVLQPVEGARAQGDVILATRGDQPQLAMYARLRPSSRSEAYEVWLYNSERDARSLGAQVTDRQGNFQVGAPLPAGFAQYRFIDVSREPVDENRRHSGRSVLRGRIDQFQSVPGREQSGQRQGVPGRGQGGQPRGSGTTTQP